MSPPAVGQGPTALVDAAGTAHVPVSASADARIVSLVPSLTELLIDLGLADRLVGRTGFCIHPRDVVRTIPKVGGTKDVKLERIRELEPTHVVLNVDENTRQTFDALRRFVPHLVVTHPIEPTDNPSLYRLLGGVFGVPEAAQELCDRFEAALASVRASGAGGPQDVLYLIWRDPWMTVSPDTYISRTLATVGWQTLPRGEAVGDRYPTVALEDYAGRVDRVLLSSEPFHFHQRHIAEVAAAVAGAQVTLIDGEMTSWYGSRAIDGLRYLARYAA